MRRVECRLDMSALLHNLAQVKRYRPGQPVLAMVKADAYGHGLVAVARHLREHVDALGVACLDEAMMLREGGVHQPIVLMEGLFSRPELEQARRLGLDLVVHQRRQLEWLQQAQAGRAFDVWLKVNTGMNRLGFGTDQAIEVYQALRVLPHVRRIVLMTHLATADQPGDVACRRQVDAFYALARALGLDESRCSICNSAAIVGWPDVGGSWLRPGLMLYGASPLVGTHASELGLRPVMSLKAHVVAVQTVQAGDRIGYGGQWVAEREQRIAVVGAGYGDGYPRTAGPDTPVAIAGRRFWLAGRVSMDMLAVDIGQDDVIKPDDEVELWGRQVAIDEVAQASGTLSYELMCKLTARVARHYVY